MTVSDAMLTLNPAPLWLLGGAAVFVLLLLVIMRLCENIPEWRETATPEYPGAELDAVPRREALELIAKLGAVRARMLELNHALTQRREGVRWRVGIGDNADSTFRDADSDVDQFLSGAAERDLNAAQGEMISLFRDAAIWLEKYAPEESPPPSVRERITNALQTFFSRFFPALKQDADRHGGGCR